MRTETITRLSYVALSAIAALLFVNEALFLVGFSLWMWWQRETVCAASGKVIRDHTSVVALLLPLSAMLSLVFYQPPSATDDLLRNIVAWRYGYDYTAMYPNSKLFSWSMWFGFDQLFGLVGQVLPPKIIMWSVEALALASLIGVMLVLGLRELPDNEDRMIWVSVGIWAAVAVAAPRLAAGRPEIFCAIWALGAAIPKRAWETALWVVIGSLLSVGYWLAIVYFPAVILLRRGWKERSIAGGILGTFHLAFWLCISNGQYLEGFVWLGHVLNNQVGPVGENAPIVTAFIAFPSFSVLFVTAVIGVLSKGNRPWLTIFVALYFFSANQVRYAGTVAPFLVLLIWQVWAKRQPMLNTVSRASLLLAGLLLALTAAGSLPKYADIPKFVLPNDSKTLTAFGPEAYAIPFHATGIAAVAPSYALGATEREIQTLSFEISRGKADCAGIKKWGFSHVVEKSISGTTPQCLSLLETQKGWRLWEVK